MRTLTTPHTPDYDRLSIEDTLIDTVVTALGISTDRVTAGYFAAPGRAIITITGCAHITNAENTARAAVDALNAAGYPLHFADFGRRGPARGVSDYRTEIAVNVR